MQAKAHIDHHLHDPTLCPASVAAALHVSLRTLYRAFDEQDQPAAAWIRQRRLERCRRDLIDPAHSSNTGLSPPGQTETWSRPRCLALYNCWSARS